MALMDTIKGARQEAADNGAFDAVQKRVKRQKDADGQEGASAGGSAQGFTRKSASKARPSRQQAAGVRVVSSNGKRKSRKGQTKEEVKAERKHDREVSDLRYNVSQKMLKQNEDYSRARKNWWKFLIVGVALMVISIALYVLVTKSNGSVPDFVGLLGLTAMAGAYAVIIAGFIYDWRVIRPLRKEVDQYVQSMSEKRLITAINKDDKGKGKGKKGRKK